MEPGAAKQQERVPQSSSKRAEEVLNKLGIAEDYSGLKSKEHVTIEPDSNELKRWMNEIGVRVRILRQMKVEREHLEPIFEILKEDLGYDEIQKYKAELWILKGDWRYKRELRLEVSDFYPKPEYIEHFFKGIYRGEDVISVLENMKHVMSCRRRLELDILKNEYEEKLLFKGYADQSKAVTGMAKEVAMWIERNSGLEKELKEERKKLNEALARIKKQEKIISELNQKLKIIDEIQPLSEKEYFNLTSQSPKGEAESFPGEICG